MMRVIVADPPWQFRDNLPATSGGAAARQYQCMTVHEIMRLDSPYLVHGAQEAGAVLFLWRVASMQEEALAVARCWGFTPKTEIVWEKTTKKGKPHFGMGHYVRASHETCLVCVRGKAPVADKTVRSRFSASVREHSRKPDEFFEIVEKLYPIDPTRKHIELFARTVRHGWHQHGNQLGGLI